MSGGVAALDAPPPMPEAATYRPAIDGLRAVAVVPVVLFHLGVGALPGGFVGVDVFFVISGYLITGILFREMQAGRFSLARFYERRIRRILPNLYAMILATTLVACVLLIPFDLTRYGQSVVATLGFAANVYFWFRTGYFAPASDQLPLLHTWSLGVEEQYYLVSPLLLLLLADRHPRRIGLVVAVLFATSFALAVHQVRTAPDAAFYLPLARWWELMTGSFLALGLVPRPDRRVLREALALAGLTAIVAAIALYRADLPFPGVGALAPCLGAAAVIQADRGGDTAAGRLLGSRPLRAIGLLSYSLYLWHWPVIVFARYLAQRALTAGESFAALLAIVALAYGAYRWIEVPVRSRRIPARRLFVGAGVGAGALASVAATLVVAGGLPGRYPPAVRPLAMAVDRANPDRLRCDSPSPARLRSGDVCVIGAPGVAPSFALIGDSFADALSPGVAEAARRAGLAGIVLTRGGCLMLAGAGNSDECRDAAARSYALIARSPGIRRVVLIGRWPTWYEARREGLFPQERIWIADAASGDGRDVAENRAVLARGLRRTAALPAGRRLTVVVGLPEQHVHVPQYATLRTLAGLPVDGLARADYDRRQRGAKALIAGTGVDVLDLGPAMCDAQACPIVRGGEALFVDDNHPSRDYARALAPWLRRAVE